MLTSRTLFFCLSVFACLSTRAQVLAEESDAPLQRLAAVLSKMPMPENYIELPPPLLDVACDAAGFQQTLVLIDSGHLSSLPATFALTSKSDECGWTQNEAGKEILKHYEPRSEDIFAVATLGLAFGAYSVSEYTDFGRDYLARLTANDVMLEVPTAALSIDIAAGLCTTSLTPACVRPALRKLLPATFKIDHRAVIAFGDLLGLPLPDLTQTEAEEALKFLIQSGAPIRLDLIDAVGDPRSRELKVLRKRWYQHAYGTREGL